MKKFFLFCLKILVLVLLTAVVLDILYTTVYSYSNRRNKIEYVINSGSQQYDVLLLGSSRANNHFVPKIFEDKGLKTYNFGMSGSRLQESALLLQLMLERNWKIKNLVLEVDLNINSEGHSEGTRARFMPYLQTSQTISDYYQNKIDNFDALYYVPFYRYIKYDSQIGFREMFFAAVRKPSSALQNDGYYPLRNEGKNLAYNLTEYSPKRNRDYEMIRHLCAKHGINLITVTTPICKNSNNEAYFSAVQKLYPEIHRCDQLVKEDRFFSSCGHMNDKGAKVFTQKIVNKFFN